MTLGQRIQAVRQQRGMGLRELTRAASVPPNTLSQLERDLRTDITTATAKRLARALQVSLDDLVGMYEEDETTATAAR